MVKYRTVTYLVGDTPLSEILYRGPFEVRADQVRQGEAVLSPRPIYDVWNCRVALAFEVDAGGAIRTLYPPFGATRELLAAAEADIRSQGGALNISGIYRVTAEPVRRWAESQQVQDWLRAELGRLGLEVLD